MNFLEMCFHPQAASILVEEIMRCGLCRKRKPFSGFASPWKPPLMPIELRFRSNFIPSHCISLPHFPFTPLCLCQQVAHKHTCLPWSRGAAGQKAPSAAHLSPHPSPTSPAKPSFQQSSLADTPNGALGNGAAWPVAGWRRGEARRMSNPGFFPRGGVARLDGADARRLMGLQPMSVFFLFHGCSPVSRVWFCYPGQVSFGKRDS